MAEGDAYRRRLAYEKQQDDLAAGGFQSYGGMQGDIHYFDPGWSGSSYEAGGQPTMGWIEIGEEALPYYQGSQIRNEGGKLYVSAPDWSRVMNQQYNQLHGGSFGRKVSGFLETLPQTLAIAGATAGAGGFFDPYSTVAADATAAGTYSGGLLGSAATAPTSVPPDSYWSTLAEGGGAMSDAAVANAGTMGGEVANFAGTGLENFSFQNPAMFDMGLGSGLPSATGAATGATASTVGTGITAAQMAAMGLTPSTVGPIASGGLSGAGTGGFLSTLGAALKTGATKVIDKLSDPFTVAQTVLGIQQSGKAADAAKAVQESAMAQLGQSNPFDPGRQAALAKYLEYLNNPNSYFSSPMATMQLDELGRQIRAKQSQVGQTWNVDPATGQVRGSGTGADDFAKGLQTNMAGQYQTVMGNLAQQAGMSLFPNPGFISGANQANQAANQQQRDQYGGYGMLIGAGRELFPELGPAISNKVKSIFGIGA